MAEENSIEITRLRYQKISRRNKTDLKRFADRYNLPGLTEDVIDLAAVIPELHDTIGLVARGYIAGTDEESGEESRASAERRAAIARADKLEIDRDKRNGEVIDFAMVDTSFRMIESRLRAMGDRFERECGSNALSILHEGIEDISLDIQTFADDCANQAKLQSTSATDDGHIAVAAKSNKVSGRRKKAKAANPKRVRRKKSKASRKQ